MIYKDQVLDSDNLIKISIVVTMSTNISTSPVMIMLCDCLVLHIFETTLTLNSFDSGNKPLR